MQGAKFRLTGATVLFYKVTSTNKAGTLVSHQSASCCARLQWEGIL